MKKIDINQTIQILANLGVLAGIVFLGIELQQNNVLLGAQTRMSRTELRVDGLQSAMSNPGLLQVRLKSARAKRSRRWSRRCSTSM